jgi:hypothetical protein
MAKTAHLERFAENEKNARYEELYGVLLQAF